MCSRFDSEWICNDSASSKSWSSSQLSLTISTFITTRLGIFVVAVLLMASIVLQKPERRVDRRQRHGTSQRSVSVASNHQILDTEPTGSDSVVSIESVSTPRGGLGDIPDTIGGTPTNSLSICGTFSPVGSMSMDPIDEEGEE